MEQRTTATSRPGAGIARGRVVSLAAAGVVFLAGLVFALGGGGGSAAATPGLTFRTLEITLLVPTDQGDGYVRIHLLLADDGSGSFDDVVAKARADALAGFPDAIELEPGDVTAAYATFTSWSPPTASWSYNSSGEPSGLSGVGSAISGGANSWNGVGGSTWSFAGGGSTGLSPTMCPAAGDGQNVVGWKGSLGGSILARTCTRWGAFATEFDMEFSAAWNWTIGNPIETDLKTVAIHEFGHALGLLHTQSENCPGAVMCASYNSGTVMNGPQTDDVNGVVFLYGGTPVTPGPTATTIPTSTPIPPPPPAPTATDTPVGGAEPTNTPISGGGGAPPPAPNPTQTLPTPVPPPSAPTAEPQTQTFFVPGIARD